MRPAGPKVKAEVRGGERVLRRRWLAPSTPAIEDLGERCKLPSGV